MHLYLALYPKKLTSMNYLNKLPCLLVSGGFSQKRIPPKDCGMKKEIVVLFHWLIPAYCLRIISFLNLSL